MCSARTHESIWGKKVASIFRDAADQKRFVVCSSVGCLAAIFVPVTITIKIDTTGCSDLLSTILP